MVDSNITQCLFSALWAAEAKPVMFVIPTPRFDEELPATAAAAIKAADMLIAATSKPVSRSRSVQEARDSGVRYFAMGGITTEAMLEGAIAVDFEELYYITAKFARILEKGDKVHITTEAGTDLAFSIKGRKVMALDGRLDEVSKSAGLPSGEAACSPVEGTAEGVAVIDGGMHELGLIREPIILKIKDGKVYEITGGAEAVQLSNLLTTSGDADSYNIAEFAFGSNSAARVSDNIQEFKNRLGTVHLALGNNKNLFGTVYSKTHLDAIIMKPTVIIDDKLILDKGQIVTEN